MRSSPHATTAIDGGRAPADVAKVEPEKVSGQPADRETAAQPSSLNRQDPDGAVRLGVLVGDAVVAALALGECDAIDDGDAAALDE